MNFFADGCIGCNKSPKVNSERRRFETARKVHKRLRSRRMIIASNYFWLYHDLLLGLARAKFYVTKGIQNNCGLIILEHLLDVFYLPFVLICIFILFLVSVNYIAGSKKIVHHDEGIVIVISASIVSTCMSFL